MKRKILITGGAGFIGSHTAVALFENGYLPIILDNFSNSEKSVLDGLRAICGEDIPCHEGDCTQEDVIRRVLDDESGIEGVIHFAAYKSVNESMREPLKYYKNNIGSLLSLMEVMTERGVRNLVFSSSCTVYGQPERVPVDESAPMKVTPSPYGKTKQLCEKILAESIHQAAQIKCVSLRYFNPIGAHPSAHIGELPIGVPNNLVPFITQTAAGLRDQLTVFGDDYKTSDGTAVRDYIHVLDLADAHVRAFEYLETVDSDRCYEVVNVGTGNGISVKQVVDTFEQVNNLKLNYKVGPRREGDVEAVYADATRGNDVLKWRAKRSLEEALKDAWNWQQRLAKNGEN